MNKGEILEIKGLDYKLICEQEEIIFPTYAYACDLTPDKMIAAMKLAEEDKKNPDEWLIYKDCNDEYDSDQLDVHRIMNSFAVFKPDNGSNHTYIIAKMDINHEMYEGSGEYRRKVHMEGVANWDGDDVAEVIDAVFHIEKDWISYEEFLNYIHSHLNDTLTIVIEAEDYQFNGVHIIEGKTITSYNEYEELSENIKLPELDDITYFILTEKNSDKAEHLYKLGYLNDES